jgi:hypothetical protein
MRIRTLEMWPLKMQEIGNSTIITLEMMFSTMQETKGFAV